MRRAPTSLNMRTSRGCTEFNSTTFKKSAQLLVVQVFIKMSPSGSRFIRGWPTSGVLPLSKEAGFSWEARFH